MKNLFIIIGIITIFAGYGCKKDKVEPVMPLKYGETLSFETLIEVDWDAYVMTVRQYDTLWPLGSTGFPVKERNPITGDWNFIGIKNYEVTLNEQLVKVAYTAAEQLAKDRDNTIAFFNSNPGIKIEIKIEFPGSEKLINRVNSDGSKFSDKIMALNNVRELLVKYPDKTLSQIITEIYNDAQSTWLLACREYFIDKVLHPQDPQK